MGFYRVWAFQMTPGNSEPSTAGARPHPGHIVASPSQPVAMDAEATHAGM